MEAFLYWNHVQHQGLRVVFVPPTPPPLPLPQLTLQILGRNGFPFFQNIGKRRTQKLP